MKLENLGKINSARIQRNKTLSYLSAKIRSSDRLKNLFQEYMDLNFLYQSY